MHTSDVSLEASLAKNLSAAPEETSVFFSYLDDPTTALCTTRHLPLEEFTAALSSPKIVAHKSDTPLLSGVVMRTSPSGRRVEDIKEAHMLIFDYDNASDEVKLDPTLQVTFESVASRVAEHGINAHIVTSISHTEELHKFRLFVFLGDPLPLFGQGSLYTAACNEALVNLGLSTPQFLRGLDPTGSRPTQFFFAPAIYNERRAFAAATFVGDWYNVDEDELRKKIGSDQVAVKGSKTYNIGTDSTAGQFSSKQVAKYYLTVIPNLVDRSASEWRGCCPLHDGTNKQGFHVNKNTGLFYCFSPDCSHYGTAGGNIYTFHQRLRNKQLAAAGQPALDWASVRYEVDTLLGAPSLQPAAPSAVQAVEVVRPVTAPDGQRVFEAAPPAVTSASSGLGFTPSTVNDKGYHFIRSFEDDNDRRRAVEVFDTFGARIPADKYELHPKLGTNKITKRFDKDGNLVVKHDQISPYNVWINRVAEAATYRREPWVELAWTAPGARGTQKGWIPMTLFQSRRWEDHLPHLAVDYGRSLRLTEYLTDSLALLQGSDDHETDKVCNNTVITQFGWTGDEHAADRRLVLYPEDQPDNIIVMPEARLSTAGTIDDWKGVLRDLADQPFLPYACMWVALGLSAAAPMVRLMNMRNPILMLAAPSSRGKSTITEMAASIWCNAEREALIAAQSTAKGTEDRSVLMRDLPIIVDEFQRKQGGLNSNQEAEAILYGLGNGVRRTVSSKTGVAVGGQQRSGVNFINTEVNFISQLEKGARNRTLILNSEFPLPSRGVSNRLRRLYTNNYGVVGRQLVQHYNDPFKLEMFKRLTDLQVAELESMDKSFVADDIKTLSIINQGLVVLGKVLGLTLPAAETLKYLLDHIDYMREGSKEDNTDVIDQAFIQFVDRITNAPWGAGGTPDIAQVSDGIVGFRGAQRMYPQECAMEIAINSRIHQEVLRNFGLKSSAANDWVQRGYILRVPNKKNQPGKFQRLRREGGPTNFLGEGMFVYCVAPLGMGLAQGASMAKSGAGPAPAAVPPAPAAEAVAV